MTHAKTVSDVRTLPEIREKQTIATATLAVGDIVSCPECGVQAVVEWHVDAASTGGSMQHVKIRCDDGHWFLMPTPLLLGHDN